MFSVTYLIALLMYLNNDWGCFQYPAKMVEVWHSVAKTAKICRAGAIAAVNNICEDFHPYPLSFSFVFASTTRDIRYRIFLAKFERTSTSQFFSCNYDT